jgi:Ca2+-binding RTX toxin-like protein
VGLQLGEDPLDAASNAGFKTGGPTARTLGSLTTIRMNSVRGTASSDTLSGFDVATSERPNADLILGGSGNDVLSGLSGNDHLEGDSGRDLLLGGADDDRLYGRTGDDRLNGGAGNDLLEGGRGRDTLRGDDGNDRLNGGAGNDSLAGGVGDDRLTDARGTDELRGGPGNDRLSAHDTTAAGRRGIDTVSCGAGRRDVAIADRRDRVSRDCERVIRR